MSFCTGGIRCEKAAIYLRESGVDAYQLDGGILGYFEQVGGDHFTGECFVFDEREALAPDSLPGRTVRDDGRRPDGACDRASPRGVGRRSLSALDILLVVAFAAVGRASHDEDASRRVSGRRRGRSSPRSSRGWLVTLAWRAPAARCAPVSVYGR